MQPDLTTLRLVLSVIEERSMAKAAEREHISTPAISKRIADLEQILGVTLLERHSRGVRATAAGRALAANARSIFEALARMQGQLSEYATGVRGEIRLCANPTSIGDTLPAQLQSFAEQHPLVRIYLDERRSADVVAAVTAGDADVGICAADTPMRDLQTVAYHKVPLVLATPAHHPLARKRGIRLADTAKYEFVGLAEPSMIATRVMAGLAGSGFTMKSRIQVVTHDAMRRVVQSGMGIGILPACSVAPYAKLLGIRAVPLLDKWAYLPMVLCTRSPETLPQPARRLLAHLRSRAPRTARAGNPMAPGENA